MKTLALDLATNTGFALGDASGLKLSGSRRFPQTGDDVGRFARSFRDWLTTGLRRHLPGRVVFEQPLLRGESTTLATCRKLYGMAWQVELTCSDLVKAGVLPADLDLREVNTQDWCVHFLGRGNVPRKSEDRKKAVTRMCGIRGWKVRDHDEADACAILDYSIACHSPAAALAATPLFADVKKPFVSAGDTQKEIIAKAAGLRR